MAFGGARDGYRGTVQVRPSERCEGTKLFEIHHVDGGGDVLLVPDEELATVCRKLSSAPRTSVF